MTCYVQIVYSQRQFQPDDWTPWTNCQSVSEAAQMAAHKFIQEAGYALPTAEFEPFDLEVFVANDKTPRHGNGRFLACRAFKMRVSKIKGGQQ